MNIFDLQATISLNSSGFETGVQNAQTAFGSLGESVSAGAVAIGNILADMAQNAAAKLGEFAGSVLDTGMSFDTSMANVAAISGATGDTLDALRDKAKEMGASTKFTATEAADAFSYMAMAGWDAEQMMDGITGIMNLAAASGENLATTSDIVTDALTAFGLSAEDSGHFADVLAAASSAANTNVFMMGETFKYVAPVAGSLGYSVEDMAAAIGTMANSGIKASQAGTTLRAALNKLLKPSEDAWGTMKRLGIAIAGNMEPAGEFEYDLKALSKYLNAVENATAKVEKAQQKYNDEVAKSGAESAKSASALQKLEETQKNLVKAEEELTQAKYAQREAASYYNSALVDIDGNMQGFGHTVQVLRDAFANLSEAEQAETAATLFGSEAMSGMLAIINSSAEEYNALAETIYASSDAMGGMGTAAEMAAVQLDNLPGQITIMQSAFDGFKNAIYEKAKDPLQELAAMGAEAFSRLTDAVNNGGVLGAFEALGGIIADIVGPKFAELTDTLLPGLQEGFANASAAFQPFIDAVTGAFSEVMPVVTGAVQDFVSAIGDSGIAETANDVAAGARSLFDTFVSEGAQNVGAAAESVSDFISGFTESGGNGAIASVAESAGSFFNDFLIASDTTIKAVGDGTRAFLKGFDDYQVGEAVAELAQSSADLFDAVASTSGEALRDVADGVAALADSSKMESAGKGASDMATAFAKLGSHINEGFAAAINSVSTAFQGLGKFMGETVAKFGPDVGAMGSALGEFLQICTEIGAGIEQAMRPALTFLSETLVAGLRTAWALLVSIIGGIVDAFRPVVTMINETLRMAMAAFRGDWEEVWEHAKEGANAFAEFIEGLGDMIIRPIRAIIETMKEIGGEIIEGLKQGISDAWTGLTSWFDKKVEGLVGGIKDFFGIHSPSTVFAGIGENLVLGMREGWGDAFGGLERQIDRDMASINGTARIGFENSALGKSSAAGISAAFAAMDGGRGGGDPIQINLVLDGDVAATALYDPLRRTAFQRGQNMTEAAYA